MDNEMTYREFIFSLIPGLEENLDAAEFFLDATKELEEEE